VKATATAAVVAAAAAVLAVSASLDSSQLPLKIRFESLVFGVSRGCRAVMRERLV